MTPNERKSTINHLALAIPDRVLQTCGQTRDDVRKQYSKMSNDGLRITRLIEKCLREGRLDDAEKFMTSASRETFDEIERIHFNLTNGVFGKEK